MLKLLEHLGLHQDLMDSEFCGPASTTIRVLNPAKNDLDPCFENTVLTGVGSSFIMIFGFCTLLQVWKHTILDPKVRPSIPWVLFFALSLLIVSHLTHVVLSFRKQSSIYISFCNTLEAVSWMLCLYILSAHQRRGIGKICLVLRVFWVLSLLVAIKLFVSELMGHNNDGTSRLPSRFSIWFSFVELPCHFITFYYAVKPSKKEDFLDDHVRLNTQTPGEDLWGCSWLEGNEPISEGLNREPLLHNSGTSHSTEPSQLPLDKLAVRSWIDSVDQSTQKTTKYAIMVQSGGKKWTTWKKREDFRMLHGVLTAQSNDQNLEQPPYLSSFPNSRTSVYITPNNRNGEEKHKMQILNNWLKKVHARREYRGVLLDFLDFQRATRGSKSRNSLLHLPSACDGGDSLSGSMEVPNANGTFLNEPSPRLSLVYSNSAEYNSSRQGVNSNTPSISVDSGKTKSHPRHVQSSRVSRNSSMTSYLQTNSGLIKRDVIIRHIQSQEELGYSLYDIEVREFISEKEYFPWTLRKRYSEFLQLRKELRDKYVNAKIPRLPPKGFNRRDINRCKEKAISMEIFLQRLLSNNVLGNSPELEAFLALNEARNVEVHVIESGTEA